MHLILLLPHLPASDKVHTAKYIMVPPLTCREHMQDIYRLIEYLIYHQIRYAHPRLLFLIFIDSKASREHCDV